jgi:predicted trehalose synthase
LRLDHLLVMPFEKTVFHLLIVETVYTDRESEYYFLPLALSKVPSERTLFQWQADGEQAFVVDALGETMFHKALFESTLDQSKVPTTTGVFVFDKGSVVPHEERYVSSFVSSIDQSNSSIFYNGRYFMKIYRKLFLDTNPEVDMLKFLSESGKYSHVPAYAGSLVWERKKTAPVTLALLMNKVSAEKDSWVSTGDELNDFLFSFLKGSFSIHEFVFEHVELLAKRTAEMHLALSVSTKNKAFKAEKFDENYRQWLYEHLMHLLDGRMKLLKQHAATLDEEAAQMAAILFKKHGIIKKFFDRVKNNQLPLVAHPYSRRFSPRSSPFSRSRFHYYRL